MLLPYAQLSAESVLRTQYYEPNPELTYLSLISQISAKTKPDFKFFSRNDVIKHSWHLNEYQPELLERKRIPFVLEEI